MAQEVIDDRSKLKTATPMMRQYLDVKEQYPEMNGPAATDYNRLSELDSRKTELEERLLEIYEEI